MPCDRDLFGQASHGSQTRVKPFGQDIRLDFLASQAANIGPNIPAIAPAKPMITYSCQPLNQFMPNIRFSKQHSLARAVEDHNPTEVQFVYGIV